MDGKLLIASWFHILLVCIVTFVPASPEHVFNVLNIAHSERVACRPVSIANLDGAHFGPPQYERAVYTQRHQTKRVT